MNELLQYLKEFNTKRNWNQSHTPNNLAKSIVLEANELLEHFQFNSNGDDYEGICEELADTMIYCLDLCNKLNIDPIQIIYSKIKKNAIKYPYQDK